MFFISWKKCFRRGSLSVLLVGSDIDLDSTIGGGSSGGLGRDGGSGSDNAVNLGLDLDASGDGHGLGGTEGSVLLELGVKSRVQAQRLLGKVGEREEHLLLEGDLGLGLLTLDALRGGESDGDSTNILLAGIG